MIYHNTETDKDKIISEDKGKAAIYMWTHIKTGRIYIGLQQIYQNDYLYIFLLQN